MPAGPGSPPLLRGGEGLGILLSFAIIVHLLRAEPVEILNKLDNQLNEFD